MTAPLRLVPAAPAPCHCGCGRIPDPNRWPGDEGFDSAVCRELYRLEQTAAEVRRSMHALPNLAGLGF